MSNELYAYIGDKIRIQREQHKLTQEALAGRMGVSANTISRWETTAYKPSVNDLDLLARLFGVPIWSFFPSPAQPPTDKHHALLRAAGDLPEEDLDELERYADFIRARKVLRGNR